MENNNIKLLGGMAIINDSIGKRITYSYSVVNQDGKILEDNKRESYLVLDQETLDLITKLEEKVKIKMGE